MKKILIVLLFLIISSVTGKSQVAQLRLACDINPGGSGDPNSLTAFNNRLFFYGNRSSTTWELWSYKNGIGTLEYDLNPGGKPISSQATSDHMGVLNGKLYFAAKLDTVGEELYSYDGINPPVLVADIETGAYGSYPKGFFVAGNKLYFSASTVASGWELYTYDGVSAPVKHEIHTGALASYPSEFTLYNGKIYFSATGNSGGDELYVYDPLTDVFNLVADIIPGSLSSSPTALTVANGKLYFIATSANNGNELHSYDGTSVTRVTDIAAVAANGVNPPTGMGLFNNELYFGGMSSGLDKDIQLYKYNLSSGIASLVSTINPIDRSVPTYYTVYKNRLFFSATNNLSGIELWETDGTSTHIVSDLVPGVGDSGPIYLTVWNDSLYMSALTIPTGRELYRLDSVTTTDVSPGSINVSSAKISPNPARESAQLELYLMQPQTLSLYLTDMSGRTIRRTAATGYNTGKNNIIIPLDGLAAGAYFYHLADNTGQQLISGKLIKE